MATNLHFIVCSVRKTTPGSSHEHVTEVGLSTTLDTYQQRLSVASVRAAIRTGDRFYTVGPSGKAALVELYDCPTCRVSTIRSGSDSVTDNNLDKMSSCT
jgi:hypothetical protein